MDYTIEIEELTKTYQNKFTALSNLSLKVPQGVFAFLGPNGAGKTTAIRMLVGAIRPTRGTARILNYDIIKDSLEARRLIGYLPEKPGFYDGMSGRRFLRYMAELGGVSSGDALVRAGELLNWVGLGDWGDSQVGTYSAGMKQRLALAQSLINNPEVIFLDEPASNLDPLGKADLVQMVRQLARQGRTIFVSSHFIPEVEQMADHVAIIAQGQLVLQGSVKELTAEREVKDYRIDVPEGDLLADHLEAQGFLVKARLEGGQILVEARDEKKLSSAVLAFCSEHETYLRLFEPLRSDLQAVFEQALGKTQEEV